METLHKNLVQSKHLEKALSYQQYRRLISDLLAQNKTTGTDHSEKLINFTQLNVQRMDRAEKTSLLGETILTTLNQLSRPLYWIVLTEAWCGDAALSVPVIAKIAEACDKITLKILLRDENLDLMDNYLTNGGRSIPKLIAIDAQTWEEVFVWGPRPAPAQELFLQLKKEGKDYAPELQKWYAKDRSLSLQSELNALLRNL